MPVQNREPSAAAIGATRQLAQDIGALIIAGTAHEERSLGNAAHVFYPDCKPSGVKCYKQTSAFLAGERISISPERLSTFIRAHQLRIGLLICSDLADYSAVSRIVQQDIEMLLVPCYSKDVGKLPHLAREISAAMRGCVALVNYYHPDQLPAKYSVFFSGQEEPRQSTHDILLAGRIVGEVNLFTISFDRFLTAKRGAPAVPEPRQAALEWMFQSKDESPGNFAG